MVWRTLYDDNYICGSEMWELIFTHMQHCTERFKYNGYDIEYFEVNQTYVRQHRTFKSSQLLNTRTRDFVVWKFVKMFAGRVTYKHEHVTSLLLRIVLDDIKFNLIAMMYNGYHDDCDLYNQVVDAINEYQKKTDEKTLFSNNDFKKISRKTSLDDIDVEDAQNIVEKLSSFLLFIPDNEIIDKTCVSTLITLNKSIKFDWKTNKDFNNTPNMRLQYITKRMAVRRIIRFLIKKVNNAKGLRQFLWRPQGPLSKLSYENTLNARINIRKKVG